jgi:hypothetical protein
MATSVPIRKGGRKPDELSVLVAESIEYLEDIAHPITVASVKELVLDEIGRGPQIKWGPIDVQQAVKSYTATRVRTVLIRLGYVAVDGETYERVMYARRTKQHIRECIRYLKQLRRYDDNRIRFEEGVLSLMETHRVRNQSDIPGDALESLFDKIYA